MEMAKKVVLTFDRIWKLHAICIGLIELLLLSMPLSQGSNVDDVPVASSQLSWRNSEANNISVFVSKSVKDTRTKSKNVSNENLSQTTDIVITPTEIIQNSSYESFKDVISERTDSNEKLETRYPNVEISEVDDNDIRKSDFQDGRRIKSRGDSDDYYEAIKPTKTVEVLEQAISRTESAFPGEVKGVSTESSRPRETSEKKTYRWDYAEGPSLSKDFKLKFYGDPKLLDKQPLNKNHNEIEKALGKIARIAFSNDNNQSLLPETSTPVSNRKSRDEENRKASPDIQDIITGIVKILNGKKTNHAEVSSGRPLRPTSTRINNRGPPRISDVPPLVFDAPPSFVPLPPPPPSKRVPPSYPLEIPPHLPNIPLPPQPVKPGHSRLPSHPFIDGVPIPEMVVPSDYKPPNRIISEYDTISASVPQPATSQKFPPLTLNNFDNVSSSSEPPITVTIPIPARTTPTFDQPTPNKNATFKPEYNKNKVSNQKVMPTATLGNNKNGNKRVRPRPRPNNGTRIVSNPLQVKNETILTASTETLEEASKPVVEPVTEETITKEQWTPNEIQPYTNDTDLHEVSSTTSSTELDPEPTPNDTSLETNTSIINVTKESTEKVELPVLTPSIGIGEATPVLESSLPELLPSISEQIQTPSTPSTSTPTLSFSQSSTVESTHEYKVRPGIVLDDPEFKPVGHKHSILSARPIITSPPAHSHYGEIFDVTVHAVQGPGGESTPGKPFIYPVDVEGGVYIQKPKIPDGEVEVITKPEQGQDFVSIDGKRTYINLFGESTTKLIPSSTQPPAIKGTGYSVPHKDAPIHQPNLNRQPISTQPLRLPHRKPPPVRIDTCIVGDDSTCDSAQNEMCRTEDGVSSCHCRPGYNRRKHRDTCRRIVSMVTSLRVDKLYDRRVKWQDTLRDPDSEEYQQLSYEASQAIESAMSMTPFSDDFINSKINSIYSRKNLETNEQAVYINITIQLEENLDTVRPAVKHDIQRHLIRVIQRRNNNVGNSAIWVDSPPGSILALQDVDECSSAELHDCHQRAVCTNTFGSFKCQCPDGSRDPWQGNIHRQGRNCETCSPEYCNNRGECRFEQGHQICHCTGSFYGAQCEVDGEVLGVAIGASVAAAIIIILTLVCLCMWSRKWAREQKSAVGAGMGSPVFGYMATGPAVKTPNVGNPPYQVSIEDRIRWAQIADVMAQANHYAQPEPGAGGTRNSFSGYPTLPVHTMSMKGTLPLSTVTPPVPLPRLSLPNKPALSPYGAFSQQGSIHQRSNVLKASLDTTSSSEEEDRADLLGRSFQPPRPRSRASVANQSGIYYDVECDRSDIYSKQNTIPMNTYTLNPQHQVRSFFR